MPLRPPGKPPADGVVPQPRRQVQAGSGLSDKPHAPRNSRPEIPAQHLARTPGTRNGKHAALPLQHRCTTALDCILKRDDKSFDTPAWFLQKMCDKPLVRHQLREGGIAGCRAYLRDCVGVDPADAQREALNEMAYHVFGVTQATACVPLDDDRIQQSTDDSKKPPKC
ncbi:hypothetical protein L249_8034 [Ophiocordyceps polyrhachis-furcata BCC 54312]|uniref:Uncharacterized protein n=1 Tax=Ophiocordyceps polyrhachis-furcata BCC 54312 TaxID=1330021 RepID=A0A367LHZ6_9HYPO|nr:hypothetical protein L249_8034 [Ophiocordyceps polyrhachis-furcata BCC 54312]